MQKLNLSLNDAYDFVKRKKSNISPNFNFMGQLLDFERTLGLNSPCDNRSPSEQLYFTTPTNHNLFQLNTLESTWRGLSVEDPEPWILLFSISNSLKEKVFPVSLERTGFSKKICLVAALPKRRMPFVSILMVIKMSSEELPYQSYLIRGIAWHSECSCYWQ